MKLNEALVPYKPHLRRGSIDICQNGGLTEQFSNHFKLDLCKLK